MYTHAHSGGRSPRNTTPPSFRGRISHVCRVVTTPCAMPCTMWHVACTYVEKYSVHVICYKTRGTYATYTPSRWLITSSREKRNTICKNGTKRKSLKKACARRGLNPQTQFSRRASTPLSRKRNSITVRKILERPLIPRNDWSRTSF